MLNEHSNIHGYKKFNCVLCSIWKEFIPHFIHNHLKLYIHMIFNFSYLHTMMMILNFIHNKLLQNNLMSASLNGKKIKYLLYAKSTISSFWISSTWGRGYGYCCKSCLAPKDNFIILYKLSYRKPPGRKGRQLFFYTYL